MKILVCIKKENSLTDELEIGIHIPWEWLRFPIIFGADAKKWGGDLGDFW